MKNVVVLTGSGISAESGLETFRDSGGLWERFKISEVATVDAWLKNKDFVIDFYNKRRIQAWHAKPNIGHLILAELESIANVTIVTQNVDCLHEKAGSTKVVHLHGELAYVRSEFDTAYRLFLGDNEIKVGSLCPKGYQLRPDIVWFGEQVPLFDHAIHLVKQADILIVIGTSLTVYPAASLLEYVQNETPIFLIDPKSVNYSHPNLVEHYKQSASDGLALLTRYLLNKNIL